MADKYYRLSIHPWLLIMVVGRALSKFTEGVSAESRRTMARIQSKVEEKVDPDDGQYASPYARADRYFLAEQKKKNDEILRENPDTGHLMFAKGFQPLPNKALRVAVDFPVEELKIIDNALEAFARRPDVDRDLDRGITDALDAVYAALKSDPVAIAALVKEA